MGDGGITRGEAGRNAGARAATGSTASASSGEPIRHLRWEGFVTQRVTLTEEEARLVLRLVDRTWVPGEWYRVSVGLSARLRDALQANGEGSRGRDRVPTDLRSTPSPSARPRNGR